MLSLTPVRMRCKRFSRIARELLSVWSAVTWGALLFPSVSSAQQGFTDAFPPEEFAARRARVMSAIGPAVAILQGTPERPGESPLRQSNQFFYLTGVVEPRALLIIDGRDKRTTLFLQPRTARRERMIGPYLGVDSESVRITGVDAIAPRDSFATALARIGAEGRTSPPPRAIRGTGASRAKKPSSPTCAPRRPAPRL